MFGISDHAAISSGAERMYSASIRSTAPDGRNRQSPVTSACLPNRSASSEGSICSGAAMPRSASPESSRSVNAPSPWRIVSSFPATMIRRSAGVRMRRLRMVSRPRGPEGADRNALRPRTRSPGGYGAHAGSQLDFLPWQTLPRHSLPRFQHYHGAYRMAERRATLPRPDTRSFSTNSSRSGTQSPGSMPSRAGDTGTPGSATGARPH